MKRLALVLALACFTFSLVLAQRAVSGTVQDAKGETLIGASVLIKGTTSGTVTDVDGKFTVNVPADANTLVVSYTGFTSLEYAISTASNNVIITLEENASQLNEVVVTGLGIRRDKKALGYAVTTLDNTQLELRPEADISRVLRGKIAGVDITQTSGLAGSGTNIIIRGYSSISGSNQPLFVVDGVPFNTSTNDDANFSAGGATASSRFLDLDPATIAEVSVLKGLSATVLYGEAGRNGVILVTTKNGLTQPLDKKLEITVDQSIYANTIASRPDDQDSYGNGFHNQASVAFSNWGAPFDQPGRYGVAADGTIAHPYSRSDLNSVFPQYVGARYDYRPYDNLQNFFETGLISNTSINIANRLSEGSSMNFSYSYRNEDSFVPLSELDRHNFGLGFTTTLNNGLKINSTFNYVDIDRISPPAAVSFSSNPAASAGAGSNGAGGDATNGSLFANVFYTPRSVDLNGLEYENPEDRSSIYYRSGNDIQHPYWTLNNTSNSEKVRRFFGTVQATYELTPWLAATYRLGVDAYAQKQRFASNKGGAQIPTGSLLTSDRLNVIQDHNLNLQYDARLSGDFTLDGVVGFNIRRDTRESTFANSTDQFVFGLQTHDNYINHSNFSSQVAENLLGAFATASIGFRSYLYANVQARHDWTSTLEAENRTIVYPSASLSFVPTDAFSALQTSNAINFLKLRVGYGTSAGYPEPYQTRNVLGLQTRSFTTNGGTTVNTNFVDDQFGNPNLKPELHQELELGIEGKFFDNKVGIDVSYYNKESKDLILPLDLDPSTGFTNTTINAASITNKGIEIGVDITPIRTRDVSLTVNANFTRNVGTVDELAPGLDEFVISGYTNLGNFAVPGRPYGIIKGNGIVRDENGNRVVNSLGTYDTDPNLSEFGDPNPNFLLNGGINLFFKGFNFNALMAYQDGGIMYSTTASTLMARGILQETDFDRFVTVIAPGVRPDGSPNNIQITSTQHYWQNSGVFQDENAVFDATYLKLREVSLSYALPKSLLANSPFGTVTLTVSGQNLWFRAYGFPKGANFDPEVSSLGVGNGRGFELMNVPTAKQLGGSIRLTF